MNESIIIKSANTATYGGATTAVIFGFSANEVAALGGLLIAFVGLLISTWFKHQHLKIAQEQLKENAQD